MYPSCPISSLRIDTHIVRVVSMQIALITLLLLLTQERFFTLILLFDFSVRVLRIPHLSLFYIVAKFILRTFNVKTKYIDEAPKRFALYLGLTASLFITFFYFTGLFKVSMFITLVLLICALLEAVFDFCIGCKLYYLIQITRLKLTKEKILR